MGFFSWKTADTGESIWNHYAADDYGAPLRTVYLLQPNGEEPIIDARYEGYGVFGGVYAHAWLARRNVPEATLAGLDEETVRGIGVTLECGEFYVDTETGQRWSIFREGLSRFVPDVREFAGTYEDVIPELGMKPNELIASGRFVAHPVSEIVPVTVPLKFSFDATQSYEAVRASESCPHQGFFYDEADTLR